ncbi:signal peptidase I [Natronoarchaeum sp. GCM10025321]|uniref:signal peptidase I n=1 Tax=Natronoarchaeum sp. GCM10025321 TaxID=3252684 RepID=UPI00360E5711
MSVRSYVETGVVVVLLLLVAALLAGQALGQPILLSYAETGSMEPTIDAGDGFVAIPAELTGSVDEGDVITFQSEEVHGGDVTTHRVVEITEEGYVTKGDANPFTDQDDGEPLVTEGQVLAKAWQVNGEVVVIPNLGTAVSTVQSGVERVQHTVASALGITALLQVQWVAFLLLLVSAGAFLSGLLGEGRRRRDRDRTQSRKGVYNAGLVIGVLTLLIVATAAGTMLAAGGTQDYGVVSAEFDSDRPDVIPQGETATWTVTTQNSGLLPSYAVMEPASSGVEVEPEQQYLGQRSEANATVQITAPPETGYYVRTVAEYRYLAVLPPSAIQALHSVHPWLAVGTISGVIGAAFALPLVLLFGTGTIRTRQPRRTILGERQS